MSLASAVYLLGALAAESLEPPFNAAADGPTNAEPLSHEALHSQGEAPLPGRLREIRIRGLENTKRFVVTRELGWREGEEITEAQWDLGLTRLWNTVLFSKIEVRRVAVEPGVFDAELDVDENFTLYPSVTAVSTRDTLWVRAGVTEGNLFGTYREVSAHYEQFNDRVGGEVFFRNPRLFDERMDFAVWLTRLARPRPTFTLLRSSARSELGKLFDEDRLRMAARVEVGFDQYTTALNGMQEAQPSDPYVTVSLPLRFGRVDRTRVLFNGQSIDVTPATTWTTGPSGVFAALTTDARFFRKWPGNLNLALRSVTSITGATTDNFQPYVGGLETVRGYPDGFGHGRRYASLNAELRWSAFDWKYLVLMPAVFADGVLLGQTEDGRNRLASVGGGIRFLVPTFAAAGIRVDVAMPLTDGIGPSLSLGAYQFFW